MNMDLASLIEYASAPSAIFCYHRYMKFLWWKINVFNVFKQTDIEENLGDFGTKFYEIPRADAVAECQV